MTIVAANNSCVRKGENANVWAWAVISKRLPNQIWRSLKPKPLHLCTDFLSCRIEACRTARVVPRDNEYNESYQGDVLFGTYQIEDYKVDL